MFLMGVACSLAWRGCVHADPDPAWALAEHPQRIAFPAPAAGSGVVAIVVPAVSASAGPANLAARGASGRTLPVRVLNEGDAGTSALVSLQGVAAGHECFVYYGADKLKAAEPAAPARDPQPIELSIHRLSGQSFPNTWERMLYLQGHSGAAVQVLRRDSFQPVTLFMDEDEATRNKRAASWLAVLRTVVSCPAEGVYRFAVGGSGCGYLLVDGEVAVEQADTRATGGWQGGKPVFLGAGVHELTLYCGTSRAFRARLGWSTPGKESFVAIPDENFVAVQLLRDGRSELRERTLHPHFTYTVGAAYRFWGHSATFVPVRFVNGSRNWGDGDMECTWIFGAADGRGGDNQRGVEVVGEDRPFHVLSGQTRHGVQLRVKDAEGYTEMRERVVDCRWVVPTAYPLTARVEGVPGVCFGDDVVAPRLLVSGSAPAGVELDVSWSGRVGGVDTQGVRRIVLDHGPVGVTLARRRVCDLGRVKWAVAHRGTEISRGTLAFLSPPFAELPARVDGDRLYSDEGTRIVLVPYRYAGHHAQAPITTAQAFGKVVCVDDVLAPAGLLTGDNGGTFDQVLARIVNGPHRPIVEVVSLPAWETAPGSYGPLLKLVALRNAIRSDTDVAILSVALRDFLGLRDEAVFERHVAALSDLASATLGCPVLWVTPPPYPAEMARLRGFAAAVQRAADARSMPVADLYSAFLGMARNRHLFAKGSDLSLSGSGHALSAHVIARALLDGGGGRY